MADLPRARVALRTRAKRWAHRVPGAREAAAWWRARRVRGAVERAEQVLAAAPPAAAMSLRVLLPDPAWPLADELRGASPALAVAPADELLPDTAYVYAPDRADGCLAPFHLRNALLCLSHQVLDFVVVSHGLAEPPALRIATPRNALICSAPAWRALRATGRLPAGARGRILRLAPPRPGASLVDADPAALGVGDLVADGAELAVGAAPGPVAARRPALPPFAPPSRPTVLVLPAMFAVGGAERNVVEVVRQLRDRFAFVLAPTERIDAARGSLNHQILDDCEALYELGELAPQSQFLTLLETIARSHRPDVVWITNGSPWLLAHAAALRRLFATAAIVDQQAYDDREGWIEHYGDAGIQSFDRFVAINQQIRRAFRDRLDIPDERIDLVYHAMDAERFHPGAAAAGSREAAAARFGLPTDEPVYAQVGRLTAQKRPLAFLELARRARAAGLPGTFVLVGDGELAAECEAFVSRHGLAHVRRIAHCEDMSKLLPAFDALVFCSAFEGLPIAMLEALAMGVPILSTPVGDVPLVLERDGSGRLLPSVDPDPDAWLAAFRAFAEELPALRERAAAAAAGVAERFSARAAAAAYAACFERARRDVQRRAQVARGAVAARPVGLPPLSVVIPTYNRGALLADTLRRCHAGAGGVELEFVVIDDGSRDDTAARLEALATEIPNLVWRTIPNGGPGQARNLGASLAKHDVLLFLGDDIQPKDDAFFRTHAELHALHPERSLAVLGKVVWPNQRDGDVSFVMSHVQGRSGEQFGYADLAPYGFLDWRFFYTANVSVKRALVDDWRSEGFSSDFTLAAYEDGEFAYRMTLRDDPLRIFYAPASVGTHHHPYTVEGFMGRQLSAGMMARVFCERHPSPDVAAMLGMSGVQHALRTPAHPQGAKNAADFVSVIEGVKSWVRLVDQHQQLGSQWWHDELLTAVFRLCYLQGYVMTAHDPDDNVSAAYYLMLDELLRSVNRVIHVELTGHAFGRSDVVGLFSLTPPAARVSRLRAWASRQPLLARAWRALRARLHP